MKTIIAGSRGIDDSELVRQAIAESNLEITEVVSGGAKGVDQLAEQWALEASVPIARFKPDWKRYGRGAAVICNREMVEHAEAMIAIWDGHSAGTRNTIETARKQGLTMFVYVVTSVSED